MWTEGVGDANRPVGAPPRTICSPIQIFSMSLPTLMSSLSPMTYQPSGNGSSGTAVDTWLVALVFTESAIP